MSDAFGFDSDRVLLLDLGHAATIIHAGLLIDGKQDEPQPGMSITIDTGGSSAWPVATKACENLQLDVCPEE